MPESFSGVAEVEGGGTAPVLLDFDDESLTLRTPDAVVGTWPLRFCRVLAVEGRTFRLSIDGEKLAVTPDDVAAFSVVAAQRLQSSRLADRIGAVKAATSGGDQTPVRRGEDDDGAGRTAMWVSSFGRFGVVAGAFVLLVVVILGAVVLTGEPEATPAPATVATTSTLPSEPVFALSGSDFLARWNAVSDEFDVPLRIPGSLGVGTFEKVFSPYLSLQGTTTAEGIVRSIVVVADPAGDTDDDELAIAAWGVAIAVASPELSPDERRALMTELGVDLDDPQLAEVDGESERGAIRYRIRYFEDFSSVLFQVSER